MRVMEDLVKTLSRLGVSHFSREFLYLVWGFVTLVGLNLVYKPNLGSVPNFEYSYGLLNTFAILVVSYIIGRILGEMSRLFITLLFTPFLKEKRSRMKEFWKDFLAVVNKEERTLSVRSNLILGIEVKNYTEKNPALKSLRERLEHGELFLRLFLGFSLVFTLIFSWKFTVLVMVLTLLAIRGDVKIARLNLETVELLRKEEIKESKKST